MPKDANIAVACHGVAWHVYNCVNKENICSKANLQADSGGLDDHVTLPQHFYTEGFSAYITLGVAVPNPRSTVKEKHERYQVGLLIRELNRRHRSKYRVIAEPDPPEAIIQSGRTTRWAEVVTAFWNEAFAKDLNSYATPGETHVSIGSGPFINMDEEFTSKFVAAVKSKLEKKGYVPLKDRYGPGYLVVSIQYPFFDSDTMQVVREKWDQTTVNDLGCFRSVYVTFRVYEGYRVVRWRVG